MGSEDALPYIYLHTSAPTSTTTTNVTDTSTLTGGYYCNFLKITGGSWDDQILDAARTALESAGYTVTDTTNVNGAALKATKKDDTYGNFLVYVYDAISSNVETAMIAVYTYPEIDFTTESEIATSTAAVTSFTELTGDADDYPAIYVPKGASLYDSNMQEYYSQYRSASNTTMYSTVFSNGDLMLTNGFTNRYSNTYRFSLGYYFKDKEVLEAAGYTVDFDMFNSSTGDLTALASYSSVLKATKTKDDGSVINFCFTSSNFYYNIYISYLPVYQAAEGENAAYSTELQEQMNTVFDGETIPFIDLGTADTTYNVTNTSTKKSITIEGRYWDNQIATNMLAALEADTTKTWTSFTDYSTEVSYPSTSSSVSCSETLLATATTSSGKHLTMKLYHLSNSFRVLIDVPVLEITYND